MQRLYYLANDVDTSERVSEAIHSAGIRDWNFHVLSKDAAGLYIHHLHSVTPFQQLTSSTVRHVGASAAVRRPVRTLAWCAAVALADESHSRDFDAARCFTARQGGTIISRAKTTKLRRFTTTSAGRYLIMIDVRREHRARVRELMVTKFPNVRCAAAVRSLIRSNAPRTCSTEH